jgi:DNA-directed RNA polymerase specialized sigma24 family protein
MRYFGGLSVGETAEALSLSPRTVKRDCSPQIRPIAISYP